MANRSSRPKPGIREYRFDHDDAADQEADIDRQHRYGRQQRIAQGVAAHHRRARSVPWRARSARSWMRSGLQHAGACQTGDMGDEREGQRDGGED